MRSTFFACILIVASLLPSLATSQTPKEGGLNRPTFILVHGTFQWGGQWDPLSTILRKAGYSVHSPSMTGLGEREHLLSKQIGLSTHIADLENYIKWLDLTDVILVGHSYGGCVVTGVADRLPERIAHIVYLDAAVMEDGESLHLDHFPPDTVAHIREFVEKDGDGWLLPPEFLRDPPPATMRKHPFKSYTDRIDLNGDPLKSGTVIVATEMPGLFAVLRGTREKRAKERGWAFHTIEGPHPLQETSPSKEKVVEILLKTAQSLKGP
ncbi:MAG: alpha/beta fold hydrolase [Hyphomicrobiaceae bacterium]